MKIGLHQVTKDLHRAIVEVFRAGCLSFFYGTIITKLAVIKQSTPILGGSLAIYKDRDRKA